MQKVKLGLAAEEDLVFHDEDDYLTDDPWKSTSFSTQRIFRRTIYFSVASYLILSAVVYGSTHKIFAEDCGYGFYEFSPDLVSSSDVRKFFTFIEDNICGPCEFQNCVSCQES